MLFVGKETSTLSTLHGIANCVKNGTSKIVSSNRYQRLARCRFAHTYFRSSLRVLFTVFLETKTQLWKLMWAISGCCIGSGGSPLHSPLFHFSIYLRLRCILTVTTVLIFGCKKSICKYELGTPFLNSSQFKSIS